MFSSTKCFNSALTWFQLKKSHPAAIQSCRYFISQIVNNKCLRVRVNKAKHVYLYIDNKRFQCALDKKLKALRQDIKETQGNIKRHRNRILKELNKIEDQK